MDRKIILRTAKDIKPFNFKKYLLSKGWKEVREIPRNDIFLFNHPKYRQKQIVIPKEDDYELYPDDLLIAILRLQEIEQRDVTSILTQLISPDVDLLRYRIQSPQAASGSLSLSVVNKFISSVITSLRASVCDNLSPKLHHTSMGNKLVTQLLERAQFGQTEHGSFVVKVIAPLNISDADDDSFDTMRNMGIRQGIVHLLRSSAEIVKVVKNGSIKSLIKKAKDNPPFSDNLVNSLVDMQLWEDATIELSVEWSPVLPEKNVPSKITIPAEYFKEIETIGRLFAPKVEERKVEFFTGFVTELCGDTNDQGQKYGPVEIQVSTHDKETFPAIIDLKEREHNLAIKSYKENLPVTFSGKLIRRADRRREVVEIGLFQLCQNE